VSRAALVGAVEPNVALESADKAFLGLSGGDVGVSVPAAAELVAEAVLDLIHCSAEEVIGEVSENG